MDNEQHGNTGNQSVVKDNPKSSLLTIRCTPEDKGAWVYAAGGQKLAAWVTDSLNDAAKKDLR
jgi:hypothetical protein